mmetsp:Transcript_8190/g.18320  ORF Transcript_8190/g.18320 Transcript_8190/m.18320 type:complete len:244 (-) Transcript_8190:112-843(-)
MISRRCAYGSHPTRFGHWRSPMRSVGGMQVLMLVCIVFAWLLTPRRAFIGQSSRAPLRRELMGGGLLVAVSAPANAMLPPGMDSRRLSEIDPSDRKITGADSEAAQNALSKVKSLQAEVRKLQEGYEAGELRDPSAVIGCDVASLRSTLGSLSELGDGRTQQDLERVSRLILIAWYAIKNEPSVQGVEVGAEADPWAAALEARVGGTMIQEETARKKAAAIGRLQAITGNYLKASQKFLEFFA